MEDGNNTAHNAPLPAARANRGKGIRFRAKQPDFSFQLPLYLLKFVYFLLAHFSKIPLYLYCLFLVNFPATPGAVI